MTEQAYETDFWKDAQLRKAWDDIVPGEPRKTIPYTLTLEAIQKYCRVVDDLHPLYFDEAYARNSPYKGLIAPPAIHILLMFACTPADRAGCAARARSTPASPGATTLPARPLRRHPYRLEARALDKFIKKSRLFVVHDNVFFNQHDEVICSGRGWTIRPA